MARLISSASFTDEETLRAMGEVYKLFEYTCDPHGAIGYLGLKNYLARRGSSFVSQPIGVFLETAHPAKFLESIHTALDIKIEIPPRLAENLSRTKESIKIEADVDSLVAELTLG